MPSNARRCHQLTRILRICQYVSGLRFGATLEDLAELGLDCSERTTRRDLAALEAVGYLVRKVDRFTGQPVWLWSEKHKPIRDNHATDQSINRDQGQGGPHGQKAA